jgi:hypothetical protein
VLLPYCFPESRRNLSKLASAAQAYVLIEENGAGEGIRTLDPNLGKVVLYP